MMKPQVMVMHGKFGYASTKKASPVSHYGCVYSHARASLHSLLEAMNNPDATQSASALLLSQIEEAEDFLLGLPAMNFDVVKRNRRWRRLRRILRLDNKHIENIKNGKQVTKRHEIVNVKDAVLEDQTTLKFGFSA